MHAAIKAIYKSVLIKYNNTTLDGFKKTGYNTYEIDLSSYQMDAHYAEIWMSKIHLNEDGPDIKWNCERRMT